MRSRVGAFGCVFVFIKLNMEMQNGIILLGDRMSIEINVLPVGEGDCIHIRFIDRYGTHNIIIDSGPGSAVRKFRGLLEYLRGSGDAVDALCFTHIHDDHIKAAERVFSDTRFDGSIIKSVWLNVIDYDNTKLSNDMSISSSLKLQKHIERLGIPFCNAVAGEQFQIGEAVITVIAPNEVKHNSYMSYWKAKTNNVDMSTVDKSVVNGDSIAFAFSLGNFNILFLGDTHIDSAIAGVNKYCGNMDFFAVKLSHHGRNANISKELLEVVNTEKFIISASGIGTNSKDEVMDIIADFNPKIEKTVLCNFDVSNISNVNEKVMLRNICSDEYKTEEIVIKSEVYYG